jgi:hypothetical protein
MVSHEIRGTNGTRQVRALPSSRATSQKRYVRQLTWLGILRGDNEDGGQSTILLVG